MLGFDAASITAITEGQPSSLAMTDQEMLALDQAQYDAGAGPCLEAIQRGRPIVVEDISETDQDDWRQFAEAAEAIGVRSSMSVQLDLGDTEQLAASLNLYSRRQQERRDERIRQASMFAAQLAAAMQSVETYQATARLAAGLAGAMRHRAVIEQAKGILIAQRGISADDAFRELTRISQNENRKTPRRRPPARRRAHPAVSRSPAAGVAEEGLEPPTRGL